MSVRTAFLSSFSKESNDNISSEDIIDLNSMGCCYALWHEENVQSFAIENHFNIYILKQSFIMTDIKLSNFNKFLIKNDSLNFEK